jgi:hypothetical protein
VFGLQLRPVTAGLAAVSVREGFRLLHEGLRVGARAAGS